MRLWLTSAPDCLGCMSFGGPQPHIPTVWGLVLVSSALLRYKQGDNEAAGPWAGSEGLCPGTRAVLAEGAQSGGGETGPRTAGQQTIHRKERFHSGAGGFRAVRGWLGCR